MICSLMLLYSRDTEQVKDDLIKQLKGVPTYCICVDDPKFSHHQALRYPGKARLQIVFFSPGFLSFLECRPEEAYGSFRHLDPQTTVALFCCGLRETQVMCFHTVALMSYNSWPKYEATQEGNRIVFSPYFLQTVKETFPNKNSHEESVIIVPELVNKETTHIYAIFPTAIRNVANLCVLFETSTCIQITPEEVNPYVIQFGVPELILETCQTFLVKIYQSDTILAQKVIKNVRGDVIYDTPRRHDFFLQMTPKTKKLDEQLPVKKDIRCISLDGMGGKLEERENTILPADDDATYSLVEMCKKYGLEELSSYIDEPPVSVPPKTDQDSRKLPEEQNLAVLFIDDRQNGITEVDENLNDTVMPDDERDMLDGMTRSVSLPVLLPFQEECNNGYGHYLPMGSISLKPRHSLATSSDALNLNETYTYVTMEPRNSLATSSDALNLNENCGYVTMKRAHGDLGKGLRGSQEELLEIMHAFKSGQATILEVEKQFQLYQEKKSDKFKFSADTEKEEMFRYPFSFAEISKRPERKISNSYLSIYCCKSALPQRKDSTASDGMRRFSNTSIQSRLSSFGTYRRKSSNASASSMSSNATVQSQQWGSTQSSREIFTGWIPSSTTARVCPLYPGSNPPPLPARPIPISKPKTDVDATSKDNNKKKSRPGTPLPPVSSELTVITSRDIKTQDAEDKAESLIKVCEKYGLGHLGNLFLGEFVPENDINSKDLGTLNNENFPKSEVKVVLNQSCGQLHTTKWDPENTMSFRRSLSLPSTLFPTDLKIMAPSETEKLQFSMEANHTALRESNSKCEDYVNSINSNAYTSIRTYISPQSHNENLSKNILSKSQQELLELMDEFKQGSKTISQVEEQFEEWHGRHTGTSSDRDLQLLQMKHQYEKVQKTNLSGIFKFILGKPKKKYSKSSMDGKTAKRKGGKSESDTRRLSKISWTSTSSGVSDNGEVFKALYYFNPSYGETVQEPLRANIPSKHSCSSEEAAAPPPLPRRPPLTPVAFLRSGHSKEDNSDVSEPTIDYYRDTSCREPLRANIPSKRSCSSEEAAAPPPLPRRPPLTPVAFLRSGHSKEDNSDVSEAEKSPSKSNGSSPLMTIRKAGPELPPKPVNLFKKVSQTSLLETEKMQEEEQGQETRAESPDYIVPNMIPAASRRKLFSRTSQETLECSLQCQIPFPHTCARTTGKPSSSSCSPKASHSKTYKNDKAVGPSAKTKKVEETSQKQNLMVPNQSTRQKKRVEESLFYISRRWSSFPDLRISEGRAEPVYLDFQELWENRNRSISASNSPKV